MAYRGGMKFDLSPASSRRVGEKSHRENAHQVRAAELREIINSGWLLGSDRRLGRIEEIEARLELTHIEGNKDAIEYISLCLANKVENKRRRNRRKRANRKKN